jgi:hypothetical protein
MFERLAVEFRTCRRNSRPTQREIEIPKTRIGRPRDPNRRRRDGVRRRPGARHDSAAAPIVVSAGSRVVRVVKAGRLPFERRTEITGLESISLDVELKPLARDRGEPPSRPAPPRDIEPVPIPVEERTRAFVALDGGALITSSLGGDLRARCEDPCSASLAYGFGAFLSAGVALALG